MPGVSSTFTLTVTPQPQSSLSPDGSKIVGNPAGGSVDNLRLITAYGLVEMGTFQAPPDGTHAGTFNMPMLNGVQMNPGGPNVGAFGIPAMMQLWIEGKGNLYGVSFDQLWSGWDRYTWVGNGGADFVSGPSVTDPGPLPTYNPPYTPSLDNSTISGGTGSLITNEGKWEFGAVASGEWPGWHLQLNGIEVWEYLGGPGPVVVDQMTVHSHGRMFYHRTEGFKAGWRLWAMHQQNDSTGPTAAPVPIDLTISPSRAQLPSGIQPNKFVADIVTKTSDGSPFTGSFTMATTDNSTFFKIVGSQILVNTTPPNNFYINVLRATQNGATIQSYVIFGVS